MIRQQQKQKTIRVNNKKTSEKKTGTQLFRNAIKRIKICCRKWLWNRLLVRMVFKFRFEKDFKALMIMNIKNSFFFYFCAEISEETSRFWLIYLIDREIN